MAAFCPIGSVMRVLRSPAVIAATAVAGCVLSLTAPAASAAPAWKIALKVTGSNFPQFSAITASSATSAWAFEGTGIGTPSAYQLSGSTWTRRAFPDAKGDIVFAASSSSASNVWAFTFKGEALRFNGTSWSKMKSFGKVIQSGVAVGTSSAWAFVQVGDTGGLASWHFNGSSWTKVSSGAGLAGASALSASSIWGFGGTNVAHWNGSTWKKTSVKSLLPKNTLLSHSFVADIYAASSASVYAAASGGRQDEGGPLVLLHYDGHKWSKVASGSKSLGGPVGIAPDGSGGLWIPIGSGSPQSASMEHFTHGALHSVALPYRPAHLSLFAVTNGKNSTAAMTAGLYRKSFSASTTTAVILRFGP